MIRKILFVSVLLFFAGLNINLIKDISIEKGDISLNMLRYAFAQDDESGENCIPVEIIYFEGANMYEQCCQTVTEHYIDRYYCELAQVVIVQEELLL